MPNVPNACRTAHGAQLVTIVPCTGIVVRVMRTSRSHAMRAESRGGIEHRRGRSRSGPCVRASWRARCRRCVTRARGCAPTRRPVRVGVAARESTRRVRTHDPPGRSSRASAHGCAWSLGKRLRAPPTAVRERHAMRARPKHAWRRSPPLARPLQIPITTKRSGSRSRSRAGCEHAELRRRHRIAGLRFSPCMAAATMAMRLGYPFR